MLYKQKAFTLIELMITVSVVAIVLGIAIPSFNTQILNNRSVVIADDLVAGIDLARSEAVRPRSLTLQHPYVTLCASSNGTTCSGDPNGWVNGFIVVYDYAAVAAVNALPDTPPVLANPANGATTIVRAWGRQNTSAFINVTRLAPVSFIRYTSLGGLVRILNNPPVVINARMNGCTRDAERQITINLMGSYRIARIQCPPV